MGHTWVLHGSFLNPTGFLYGSYFNLLWVLFESFMGPIWIMGPSLGGIAACTPPSIIGRCELKRLCNRVVELMGPTSVLLGSYLGHTWVLHGSYNTTWVILESFMGPT